MHIPRQAKLLFQIEDGWGQLLAKHGHAVPESSSGCLPAGPVPWGGADIAVLPPTVLTPNTSAKVAKAKVSAPVA